MKISKHWGISLLAVLSIGPGLMMNSAVTSAQRLVQQTFHAEANAALIPFVVGAVAFGLFVPFGPFLRHRIGALRTYVASMCLFILGALICGASPNLLWMTIGRMLQGIGTGTVLMMMIPMLVLSFPISIRNFALFVLVGGLFGFAILGTFFGAISSVSGHWRWLCYAAGACSFSGIVLSRIFLQNEHSAENRHPFDVIGFILSGIVSALTVLTFIGFLKRGLSSPYVWESAGASLLLFVILFTTQCCMKKPFLPFKLMLRPKPILGLLVIVSGYMCMVFSLSPLQGMLKDNGISHHDFLLFYLFFICGVGISALLSALLYDKLGPGVIGILGSICIMAAVLQGLLLGNHVPLYMYACNFMILMAGVGFTVASGLMGAALGGPLPDLVQRMVAVQFIRLFAYAWIPIIASFALKKDMAYHLMNTGKTEAARMMTYHDFFFISFILSLLILCFSFGMALTGKGHKLAHKPNHHKKHTGVSQHLPRRVHDRTLGQFKLISRKMSDHEFRRALKQFQNNT
ncbi:MFS transporter [Bacillus glycinifermentans]|uniref:MFS transporter n=1 Tax=Bacillus glycinifermentans TaxID=1664069 RepID=UPI001FF5DA53|nr:MFS transporter [Bacillus glycinifermentans]UOY87672.1 MFS transporter [Bacillus glycinifermentans]